LRVSDDYLKCVCFVGIVPDNGAPIIGGTAFFVWPNGYPAGDAAQVVTARHNIMSIRDLAPGSPIVLFVNHKSMGIVPLQTDPDGWLGHPQDPEIANKTYRYDVSVYRYAIPLRRDADHVAIGRAGFAAPDFLDRYQVGVGDDLLFPGLFRFHAGTDKIRPIMRQGTIAAMPHEPVRTASGRTAEVYLAEARSIGGLSGSPVLLHLPLLRPTPVAPPDGIEPEPARDSLLGLMLGHWDTAVPQSIGGMSGRERVNMGIAIVLPAIRIEETLDRPEVSNLPQTDGSEETAAATLDFDAAVFTGDYAGMPDLSGRLPRLSADEAGDS
jgi:hypothetical protein